MLLYSSPKKIIRKPSNGPKKASKPLDLTEFACQWNVFGHDSNALGVDREFVHILEKVGKECVRGLAQSLDCCGLPTHFPLPQVLGGFADEALERTPFEKAFGRLLILTNLHQSLSPRAIAMTILLDPTTGRAVCLLCALFRAHCCGFATHCCGFATHCWGFAAGCCIRSLCHPGSHRRGENLLLVSHIDRRGMFDTSHCFVFKIGVSFVVFCDEARTRDRNKQKQSKRLVFNSGKTGNGPES